MSKPFGATSTLLISKADLARLLRHYEPSHIEIGRTWFNSLTSDSPIPTVTLPKTLGKRIVNGKRK